MFRDEMRSKERMEAVLEKKETDHMPFWPKITPSYIRFQAPGWRGASPEEIHRFIGSDYLSYTGIELTEILPGNMGSETAETGKERSVTYFVGGKKLKSRHILTEEAGDSHPVEYPVKDLDDILAMTEYYSSIRYGVSKEALERHKGQLKADEDRLFMFSMPASPIMELIQYTMGLENFAYMMADYPDEMEDLIEAVNGANIRMHRIVCEASPAKYFLSVENTSSTLIGPDLFDKYCKVHLKQYNRVMGEYGKKQILHMCGKLKALLPGIAEIPAISMEAFSSPTTGDTTIGDGFDMLPGKALIGGSSATTWILPTPEEIAGRILTDIEEAGTTAGLFLTSGGVMPFSASPETIADVWNIIKKSLYGK